MLDTIEYLLCQHLRTYILTHHAGILLSHPGVGYLYPPPLLLRLRQCYPTPQLLSYDNNNNNNTSQ